ncbi:hypothetical protein WR25_06156 isoform A [Diploscapter pachys]|uniref:ubiquitinyl hydrolase 1 n=1 Tax=Diploscapter pachys TaxID=2018661 RepID=A0A2A2KQF5_9BILA|nr:hypothetical protein WR25_06156 isoform A [Diploscapter pachys]
MKSFVKCTGVKFESSKIETFYDLQLNVQSKAVGSMKKKRFDLLESFREYTEVETLDGDNKYDAGKEHGLQPALKGVRFLSFPPILHLHLLRYQYDSHLNKNSKINNRFPFPDRLDLNEFMDASDSDSVPANYIYVLHSVLVHIGRGSGGHYVAYINNQPMALVQGKTSKWYKFDDSTVSKSDAKTAVEGNFGEENSESSANAYMLAYIREDKIDEICCKISSDEIPQALKERLEFEKAEERKKWNQTEISVLTEKDLVVNFDTGINGMNLIDEKENINSLGKQVKVKKDTELEVLAREIAAKIYGDKSKDTSKYRLWRFSNVSYKNPTNNNEIVPRMRPSVLIPRDLHGSNMTMNSMWNREHELYYLENAAIDEPGCSSDYNLVFFKFFDVNARQMRLVGSRFLNVAKKSPADLAEECIKMTGLPEGTELNFYEEIACNKVNHIDRARSLTYSISNPMDGIIIVFEISTERSTIVNAKTFCEMLSTTVNIEACDFDANVMGVGFSEDLEHPVQFRADLDCTLFEVAMKIANLIEYRAGFLLFFHNERHSKRPGDRFIKGQELINTKLHDFLDSKVNNVNYRVRETFTIFYTKLSIPLGEFSEFKTQNGYLTTIHFARNEKAFFLYRDNETIDDLLERCRENYPFSVDGSKRLRFVEMKQSKYGVIRVIKKSLLAKDVFDSCHTTFIRLEETPLDQIQIDSRHEFIISAIRFSIKNDDYFGAPFFIKFNKEEVFSMFADRMRLMLNVKKELFDSLQFSIISPTAYSDKVVRFDIHNQTARKDLINMIMDLGTTSPNKMPFLRVNFPTAGNSKGNSDEFRPAEPAIYIRN